MNPETAADAGLRLSAAEQELVGGEVRSVASLQREPVARQRYAELAELVDAGVIPPARLDQLTLVLEIGLQSGRARRVYGPDGEIALGRIYQRTPRGAAVVAEAQAVSKALQALQGQTLDDIRVTVLGPGSYSILLDTRQAQITVRLDRGGVRVDSVALGV
jgi:hypothetical protein